MFLNLAIQLMSPRIFQRQKSFLVLGYMLFCSPNLMDNTVNRKFSSCESQPWENQRRHSDKIVWAGKQTKEGHIWNPWQESQDQSDTDYRIYKSSIISSTRIFLQPGIKQVVKIKMIEFNVLRTIRSLDSCYSPNSGKGMKF